MPGLCLDPIRGEVCRVLDAQRRHVGNLKLINGRWKFKAIGHDGQGQVIPGGGPLTDLHNALFDSPDAAALNARVLSARGAENAAHLPPTPPLPLPLPPPLPLHNSGIAAHPSLDRDMP
jgi:hypothetical protein